MRKILETALDYRKKADEIWASARNEEELGHYELAMILKEMADSLHDFARELEQKERDIKNSN